MRPSLTSKRGISIAEVMVATVIFTFIMAGLYTTLVAGNSSWNSYEAATRAQQEVRKALTIMSRDFRVAANVQIVTNPGDITLTFTHPSEGNITYTWADNGSDANRILRTTDTATRIIAHDIVDLTITDSTDDVNIDVTSVTTNTHGQASSFQLYTKVAKR